MAPRQQLQDLLKTIQGTTPETETKVYYQAPSKDKMVYPCIEYHIDSEDAIRADNQPYSLTLGYQVTIMSRDPDSPLRELVARLPLCAFNRYYVADGLHHYVYKLFF